MPHPGKPKLPLTWRNIKCGLLKWMLLHDMLSPNPGICYAHFTNSLAQSAGNFEKGEEMGGLESLEPMRHTMKAINKSPSQYWDDIYATKKSSEVSWTQEFPKTSLNFIHSFGLPKSAKIIDIGGGESRLVDYLLQEGYGNITVLDISAKALEKAKIRLGEKAKKVNWIVTDITDFESDTEFDIWHDRATFHFLTTQEPLEKYMAIARKSIKGYLILGTFSEHGPKKCSGLDIKQYSEDSLQGAFANGFDKLNCVTEDHVMPFNSIQNFLFCSFKRNLDRFAPESKEIDPNN